MTQAFRTISPIILIFLRFFSLCCHSAGVTTGREDEEDRAPRQGDNVLPVFFGPGATQEQPGENPIDTLQRRIDEAARVLDLLIPPAPSGSGGEPQQQAGPEDDDAGAGAAIKQRITDALKRHNVTSACNAILHNPTDHPRSRDARPAVTHNGQARARDMQLTVTAGSGGLVRLERDLQRRAGSLLNIGPSFIPADILILEKDEEQPGDPLCIVAAAGWHVIQPGGGPQWPEEDDGSAQRPEFFPSFPLMPGSGAAALVCQQRELEAVR